MPKITRHGSQYSDAWPFEGWYGQCSGCDCEFTLQKGDMPDFTVIKIIGEGTHLRYTTDKGVLQAAILCPECGAFAAVSPDPFEEHDDG